MDLNSGFLRPPNPVGFPTSLLLAEKYEQSANQHTQRIGRLAMVVDSRSRGAVLNYRIRTETILL